MSDFQDRVRALHQRAIIIDGHSDILNSLADGRMRLSDRPQIPAPQDWTPPNAGYDQVTTPYQLSPYALWFQCMGQYDLPRFREGGLTTQVMAIFVDETQLHRSLERALDMVAAFHREIDANPDTVVGATTAADIRRAKAEGKTSLLLSFEGAEPWGRDLNLIDVFYRLGLRMVSLTHSRRNVLADGTQMNVQTGGLTALGKQALARMNELGIVVDLAHLNDTGVWEVLEQSTAPVIISHTNIRKGTPGYKAGMLEVDARRSKTKLQAIAATGGLAGVIFWNQADVAAIADELEAAIDHVGDDYVAIGSDFYSQELAPVGLEDMSKLPALTEELARRGHSDTTILKILGENYLRVFETVFKA